MKKWIIITVIIGLFGWAIYDFTIKNGEKQAEIVEINDDINEETKEVESETTESRPQTGLEKGNIAPAFELETMDGETVKLSDFYGKKILLNFWATWCPPCRAEMPDMQKFHETYEDGVVLAVNLTETENSLKNINTFLDEYGITFTVLSDTDTVVSNIYKAQALPTSYLINSEGKIHNIAIGPLNYDLMVQEFDKMD
ncbi:TlpA disulfide reductase family protein [Pseudogracilibacillus sp. SE30717A]|uniref:TlpA family protein disulfide reductase n=1 Tax=Pseudogracilibacillus sp. SE30717A TaxID=3098293 RepID=UPI00300DC786